MTDNPLVSARRALLRTSLTVWAVVAVLVLGALSAAWLRSHGAATEPVVVATRDLPAYHAACGGDLAFKQVARSAIPRGAARSLDAVRCRYLLRPVKSGQVIAKDAVGPPAPVADTAVIPLPLGHDSAAEVGQGDLVDLLLAPSGQQADSVVVLGVLVVDVREPTAGDRLVFLAVPRARQRDIASVAARGRAILTEAST